MFGWPFGLVCCHVAFVPSGLTAAGVPFVWFVLVLVLLLLLLLQLFTRSKELNSDTRFPIDFCCCCVCGDWPLVAFDVCIDRDKSFCVTVLAWLLLGEFASAAAGVIESADNWRKQLEFLKVIKHKENSIQ